MILGFELVALFEMPHPVILQGAGVFRIAGQRLLVPDLRLVILAELAVRIAEIIGDVGMLVAAELMEGGDAFFISSVEHHRARGLVAVDELLFRFLFFLFLLVVGFLLVGLGVRFRLALAVWWSAAACGAFIADGVSAGWSRAQRR